ncbi:TetR family transcriptional regulator [Kitasatospora sp. NPDC092286]|uniref:TetR family transcriptional regulator n=1 Tax=Kitasatospora sp. NPDC092286 TaxID=3364087 RepID=UPI00381D6FE2
MNEAMGLRQRKKQRTHTTISDAAITLFLRHGFDQVSVADVAAAAEVSKPTLFKYFPTKEDLVVHRFADHQNMAGRIVRQRDPGTPVVTALREHFLNGLLHRDPVTGLNDEHEILRFSGLVYSTPSLVARVGQYMAKAEDDLATTLREVPDLPAPREATARLLAGQVTAVHRVLAELNRQQIVGGATADELYPEAVATADHAFSMLEQGLAARAAAR